MEFFSKAGDQGSDQNYLSGRIPIVAMILLVFIISGCAGFESVMQGVTSVGELAGVIDASEKKALDKTAGAAERSGKVIAHTFKDFTPEQEYYVGRTVGAMIMSRYRPYQNKKAENYINTLGQTLAKASDMPETYGGYHFLILDSDEINAFAAPGGLIFVTRGMIRCCKHEDALAAVLAHEIGHVQEKHGLKAIRQSRITQAIPLLIKEIAGTLGAEELSELTGLFEDSILDIVGTLVTGGYSKSQEKDADLAAVAILQKIGYNPAALIDMLKVMQKKLKPSGKDFAKTHPSPESRVAYIGKEIKTASAVSNNSGRMARFKTAVGKL